MKDETPRREEDLIVGYTDESPMGKPVYDPIILKMALLWALLTGIAVGVISYMVARGSLPIQDLGQFSASQDWISGITGAGVGIAIGGLIGGLIGLQKMLNKHKNSNED
ncbi:MAG TPA: hypothetical protein VFM60_05905 [Salinimicrobium sp.]|nr:hypothetical protein [Salinimicrobium sp.]